AQIEKAIRARLAASKISSDKFTVHVQGGVATITGRTDVLQHKGTATRLAKAAGATKVVNQVEVSEAAKEKAAANLESGRRRAQFKRSGVASRKWTCFECYNLKIRARLFPYEINCCNCVSSLVAGLEPGAGKTGPGSCGASRGGGGGPRGRHHRRQARDRR